MEFEPGDQIKIPIYFKGNPFTHHGIYVGDYYLESGTPAKVDGVVHFEKVQGKLTIKHTDLKGFCKDPERINEIEIVSYGYFSDIERIKVVTKAFEYLQEYESYGNNFFKKLFGRLNYDIANFNCEHLATLCRLGYAKSLQGDLIKPIWERRGEIAIELQKLMY